MRQTRNKRMINVNLDLDLIDETEKLSDALGISRSALINMVMRGAVMGETSDSVGQILGLAIEAQKTATKSNAKKGVVALA